MNTAFTKVPKTISISEFRATLAASLKRVKKAPLVILDRRGDESYVLLSMEMYNELVEIRTRSQKNKNRKDSKKSRVLR